MYYILFSLIRLTLPEPKAESISYLDKEFLLFGGEIDSLIPFVEILVPVEFNVL